MKSRITLQEKLEEILGCRSVYYQPPESMKIEYPAIIYARKSIQNVHASNGVYGRNLEYEIIFISKKPDNDIINHILDLPYCRHDRHYNADNLNHDTFTIYW